MLQEGKVVLMGKYKYRVTKVSRHILACLGACDIKRCSENKDFEDLKRRMNAKSCTEIIPVHTCFKKVEEAELAPQVVYEFITSKLQT